MFLRSMGLIWTIIQELDWSPLWISVKTGLAATLLSFFLGIFAARRAMWAGSRGRAVLDGILTMPMVLPPTASGLILLLIFSRRRPVGMFLRNTFGISVVQSWLGCVVAAVVIAFPLMYRSARAAFELIDENMIYAARTLGLSEARIFRKIVLPNAAPGLLSGGVLTFARAMGEYGATSMLAGNIPGRTATVSQKIAMVVQDGDFLTAGVWVVIVSAIAFAIIVLMNLIFAGRGQAARRRRR